ncbi:hypothetical protein K503DRAFT_870735 [Rhizopogon vinicolor AM-OR11-026]|uniref:Uncharacterized protein n=1 Tax=Rhizopogon vinicolor AM-OR11-026 TaxID=1314800 RepID=A0A1B7MEZ9_9AGAM|nr:hypothetical protein K503DRAFT_870735 [Rhizopogon vinicolor AM-OR11-026]
MKGFLSFVLITMAFLKMTGAAPTVLERSLNVDKRTEKLVGEASPKTEDVKKRYVGDFYHIADVPDYIDEDTPETEDVEKRFLIFNYYIDGGTPETEDVEKRSFITFD